MTEEWYTPFKLRVDEDSARLTPGASFTTTHTEAVTDVATGATTMSDKVEQWTVEAVDEAITVPAGTFCALRVRRTVAATGSIKTYWFARGVGKIRESGAGQTEELSGYTLP